MKQARPRKGTRHRLPNQRKGEKVKIVAGPETPKTANAADRLAARAPTDSRELVGEQIRQLVGLAEECRLLRQKAAKQGLTLGNEELAALALEGRLRSSAVKAALGNREERDDWGVDSLIVPLGESDGAGTRVLS